MQNHRSPLLTVKPHMNIQFEIFQSWDIFKLFGVQGFQILEVIHTCFKQ